MLSGLLPTVIVSYNVATFGNKEFLTFNCITNFVMNPFDQL